jgi:hypothetical protein
MATTLMTGYALCWLIVLLLLYKKSDFTSMKSKLPSMEKVAAKKI